MKKIALAIVFFSSLTIAAETDTPKRDAADASNPSPAVTLPDIHIDTLFFELERKVSRQEVSYNMNLIYMGKDFLGTEADPSLYFLADDELIGLSEESATVLGTGTGTHSIEWVHYSLTSEQFETIAHSKTVGIVVLGKDGNAYGNLSEDFLISLRLFSRMGNVGPLGKPFVSSNQFLPVRMIIHKDKKLSDTD